MDKNNNSALKQLVKERTEKTRLACFGDTLDCINEWLDSHWCLMLYALSCLGVLLGFILNLCI